jgi:hypothetical protein
MEQQAVEAGVARVVLVDLAERTTCSAASWPEGSSKASTGIQA